MKKTWNKLIIVSFIVLAVVACAAIVFLYPYYNESVSYTHLTLPTTSRV